MCIRDRLGGRGRLPATVFFYQGKFFFLANNNSRKFKQNQIMSVSYTHLDVYKRQPSYCMVPFLAQLKQTLATISVYDLSTEVF